MNKSKIICRKPEKLRIISKTAIPNIAVVNELDMFVVHPSVTSLLGWVGGSSPSRELYIQNWKGGGGGEGVDNVVKNNVLSGTIPSARILNCPRPWRNGLYGRSLTMLYAP